jgi:hypothetical protein
MKIILLAVAIVIVTAMIALALCKARAMKPPE